MILADSIVVSCFTPMGGWMRNSSQELVHSLQRDLPEALISLESRLRFIDVPADTHSLGAFIEALYGGDPPSACIHFGQSRRNRIALERRAVNRLDFRYPDGKGNTVQNERILENGSDILLSNLPQIGSLADLLCREEIPTYISEDCGTSLCNQLYYLSLQKVLAAGFSTRVLFVHVPVLPVQVIEQWHDAPSLTLDLLRSAASSLIAAVAGKNS